MNSYELLYIVKADMEEEARAALISRFSDLIVAAGGEITESDEWGKKKFAYPINYVNEGYYVLVNFKSQPTLIAELERNFRITEDTVRFMIVKKD
ncbi:MAG: 30S ribosomal protein S6 [Christensenellaceae bacterium]